MIEAFVRFITLGLVLALAPLASVHAASAEYVLGAGDVVRISVFQNPDLTTEARVSERGRISFPLVGSVEVGGKTVQAAEKLIASKLRVGGFVRRAQVNILPVQMLSSQVSVLGQVNRPGRYPLETSNTRLSAMLAVAGGIAPTGADYVVLVGTRGGAEVRRRIDVPALFKSGSLAADLPLAAGDVIYVDRAPVFYIYGEVQRPGAFRLERAMTVMQGLATGGGTTPRGTIKGLEIHRRDEIGRSTVVEPRLEDPLQPDDVIYVRESLF